MKKPFDIGAVDWHDAQDDIIRRFRELEALNEKLVDALTDAEGYVEGAYECAFPDEDRNDEVLLAVRAALDFAKKVANQ